MWKKYNIKKWTEGEHNKTSATATTQNKPKSGEINKIKTMAKRKENECIADE